MGTTIENKYGTFSQMINNTITEWCLLHVKFVKGCYYYYYSLKLFSDQHKLKTAASCKTTYNATKWYKDRLCVFPEHFTMVSSPCITEVYRLHVHAIVDG